MTVEWKPIAEFDPSHFQDGREFLVWIDELEFTMAQWGRAFDGDEQVGEPKFMGEWRHIDGYENFEPVAFMDVPDYKPAHIQSIAA